MSTSRNFLCGSRFSSACLTRRAVNPNAFGQIRRRYCRDYSTGNSILLEKFRTLSVCVGRSVEFSSSCTNNLTKLRFLREVNLSLWKSRGDICRTFCIAKPINDDFTKEKASIDDNEEEQLATEDFLQEDISNDDLENIPFDLDYEEYIEDDKTREPSRKDRRRKSRKRRRAKSLDSNAVLPSLSLGYFNDKDYMSLDEVVEHLKETLCLDLFVTNVPQERTVIKYVDYLIVVSGRSTRHLKLMSTGLAKKFKANVREKGGGTTAVVEGADCLDWMVIDLGNIVVHFMLPETREKYELEKLWTLGQKYDDQYLEMIREMDEEPLSVDEIERRFEHSSVEEEDAFLYDNELGKEEVKTDST